ncbi:MAG: extracellular solute-binding protein [Oceanospirillaceae bacterium]|nr:extracellular solute-binding protein [Oceanospirillaceae bacterium]
MKLSYYGLFFLYLSNTTVYADQQSLQVICSAKPKTCQWLQDSFIEKYNIPTNIVRMSSGEALSIIEQNSANPDVIYDVWWGGTGDTHLKAIGNGFMHKFSPKNNNLLGWSTYLSDLSDGHTVGIYAGMLGIIANEKVLAAQNIDLPSCWSDLGDPKYRGQIIIANPATSGTAYTFLSTIFQIYDPFQRLQILAEIKENILKTTTSGYAALLPVANGEAALSVAFIHDALSLANKDSPLTIIIPCEGTGYEIGAASILKNTQHLKQAQQFIEYTLLAETQNKLTREISLQIFSNVDAVMSPVYKNQDNLNVINYNFRIYSSERMRKKILDTWDELSN